MGFALADGAGAGDDDGILGNDEWSFSAGAEHVAFDEIEERRSAGEDGAGGEHRAFAHQGALVDAAIAADEHIVLNDDRAGVDRLEHTADLRRGAQVHAFADLGAGTDQGVRIDHGFLVDVSAGVDPHGRGANDAARHISAAADRRAARYNAHTVSRGEKARREGVLIDKRKSAGV